MNEMVSEHLGREVPQAYREFVSGLTASMRSDWRSGKGKRRLDVMLFSPEMLAAPPWDDADFPRYALLAHAEVWKAIETPDKGPDLTEEEVTTGLVIGLADGGHLFLNLHDGSVWIAHDDWFCQRLSPDFESFRKGFE